MTVRIFQYHNSSFRPCTSATYSVCGVDDENLLITTVSNVNGQFLLTSTRYPYRDLRRSGSDQCQSLLVLRIVTCLAR